MTNRERRELLDRHRASKFPGSIVDVLSAARQGRDLLSEFEQQQSMQVAQTPQQQQQGLRPAHQAGNVNQSMAFPNVPPNTPFNTMGMKAPIDIKKFDEQGHLVRSYDNVPPGVQNLPTGPQRGTVIETPTKMQFGGQVDNTRVATPQPPQYQYQLNPPPPSPYRDQGTITPDKSSFNAWRDEDSLFENAVEFFDPTGITSWDDARRAYNSMKNRGASIPNLDEGLDMFGAIPLFGRAKLGINLAKGAAKRSKDVVNAAKKGYNYLTKGSDIINRVDAIEDEVGFLDQKQRGTGIETPSRMQAGGFNDTMQQYAQYSNLNPELAASVANMPQRNDRLTSFTDTEMTRNANRQNTRIDQTSLDGAKNVAGNVVQYHKDKPLDALGMDLAVLGQVPLVGEVADLANAGISGARGIYNTAVGDTAKAKEQFALAGLSAASAIPFAGNAVGAARIAKAGHNIAHKAHSLEKGVIGAKGFKASTYQTKQSGGRKLQAGTPPSFGIDSELLKAGIAGTESSSGVNMMNPGSTATGLYGQRFSEIRESYPGTRKEFSTNIAAQDSIFDKRLYKGLNDEKSMINNLEHMYKNYPDQIAEKGYSAEQLAGIINMLGRQGTRKYLGNVVRDKKDLATVFPGKYGPNVPEEKKNKTPDEYAKTMQWWIDKYAKDNCPGGECEKTTQTRKYLKPRK